MTTLILILLGILCWWAFGLLCLVFSFFLSKDEQEVKIEDVVSCCGMSFLGPFVGIILLACFLEENKNKVVFRKKKKE